MSKTTFFALMILVFFICALVQSFRFCPIEAVIVDGKKELREVCK